MEDPRFWLSLGCILVAYGLGLMRAMSRKAAAAALRDRELPTRVHVERGRVHVSIEIDEEANLVSVFSDATSRRIAREVSEQAGEAADG